MVRLMMQRLQGMVSRGDQDSTLRRLDVVFAPHLAKDGRDAGIWREGVQGVPTWARSECQSKIFDFMWNVYKNGERNIKDCKIIDI